jgi:hypothetical protein
MNVSLLKSLMFGIFLGLAPFVLCTVFYYAVPLLVDGNAGALLSFAVLGLYLFTFLATVIISLIVTSRKNAAMGGVALAMLGLQAALAFAFLSGMINPFDN